MSYPHRISAIGNVEISSVSGVINHQAEVVHNHANDSVLADLKSLKSTLNSGDVFKWNGANVVAQNVSEFAAASDVSDLQSAVSGKADASALADYLTTSAASSTYALASDLSDLQSTVSGKADSSALASYLTSADASSTYALASDLSSVQTDLSSKADSSALASYLTTADASSTYALASDLSSVQTDLSNKADSSALASYLTTADASSTYALQTALGDYVQSSNLGGDITSLGSVEVGGNSTFKHGAKEERVKEQAYTGSFVEVLSIGGVDDNRVVVVDVSAVYRKSDSSKNGRVEYKALWKRSAGTFSIVGSTDSALISGDADGSELAVENSSGNVSIKIKGGSNLGTAGNCVVFARWYAC